MYHPHPSKILNQAFRTKPYQCVAPDRAAFLFIGLDANYDEAIERSPIFPRLLEYHEDGVAFWQRYGVHHPFLLPSYHGDGKFYHRSFAQIGFRTIHAPLVSFVELLHIPTFGRSSLAPADLDRTHLANVNRAITHGAAQHIFIPDRVARLMRATGMFPWLPPAPLDNGMPLRTWARIGDKTAWWHYHLSVYGKFNEMKIEQLKQIGEFLRT